MIVEIPSAAEAPEALALAPQADVVLICVMRSHTRRKDLTALIESVKDRGAKAVQCVFIDA